MVQSYRAPTQYAKKDTDAGRFRAGPASKFKTGTFVSEDYAQKVRKNAKRQRLVSNIMRRDRHVSEDEARERAEEFIEADEELKKEFTQAEIRNNRREYEQRHREIRERYLYGRGSR